MASDHVVRRLAALFSADAAGYSRLLAQDEVATLQTLRAHRDAMGGLVRQHGGRVVDAVGDNLLAEFPSVVDATACAVMRAWAGSRESGLNPRQQRFLEYLADGGGGRDLSFRDYVRLHAGRRAPSLRTLQRDWQLLRERGLVTEAPGGTLLRLESLAFGADLDRG